MAEVFKWPLTSDSLKNSDYHEWQMHQCLLGKHLEFLLKICLHLGACCFLKKHIFCLLLCSCSSTIQWKGWVQEWEVWMILNPTLSLPEWTGPNRRCALWDCGNYSRTLGDGLSWRNFFQPKHIIRYTVNIDGPFFTHLPLCVRPVSPKYFRFIWFFLYGVWQEAVLSSLWIHLSHYAFTGQPIFVQGTLNKVWCNKFRGQCTPTLLLWHSLCCSWKPKWHKRDWEVTFFCFHRVHQALHASCSNWHILKSSKSPFLKTHVQYTSV